MVEWARPSRNPRRIVDPGAGSGRFAVAAGRRFPRTPVVAVEVDPLAALLGRANLAATRLDRRAAVELVDYRRFDSMPWTGRRSISGTRHTSATTRSSRAGRSGSRRRHGATASARANSPGSTFTSSSQRPSTRRACRPRRVHHVRRVARRELRLARPRAAPRRARRARDSCLGADGSGVRGRGDDCRDHVLPRRRAAVLDPAAAREGGRAARDARRRVSRFVVSGSSRRDDGHRSPRARRCRRATSRSASCAACIEAR